MSGRIDTTWRCPTCRGDLADGAVRVRCEDLAVVADCAPCGTVSGPQLVIRSGRPA